MSGTDENVNVLDGGPAVEPDILKTFKGFGPLIYDACRTHSEKIAQVDGLNGEEETFRSLNARSLRLAFALKKQAGIEPGQMITVCSYNTMDVPAITIAGIYVGAVVSFLDPNLSHGTICHLLKEVKPKLVFCGRECLQLIEGALSETRIEAPIVAFGERNENFEENVKSFQEFYLVVGETETDGFVPFEPKSTKETVLVLFSSGSTGLPKGICLSHYGLLYALVSSGNYNPGITVLLHTTSFYWITGISTFMGGLFGGCKRVVVPYFDPDTILKVVEKYKVNMFGMAYVYAHQLMERNDPAQYDLSHLKYFYLAGTAVSSEQIARTKRFFKDALCLQGYGLTENCGTVALFSSVHHRALFDAKPTSVGLPLPGVKVKIADTETGATSLGANVRGEIRIRSPSITTAAYYGRPRETAEAFDDQGWFRTGDIGYYDEDGCMYVVDRISESFKFRSWHVTPAAVEAVLGEHPRVLECVVVGVPHELDGHRATGVVVLKKPNGEDKYEDGDEEGIEQELVKFVEDRVGFWDRLHGGVKIVDTIPKTSTGKYRRMEVRRRIVDKDEEFNG